MHEISIRYRPELVEVDVLWHLFHQLLGSLRHNGQLIGRNMQPYEKDGQMLAIIFTATADALDTQHQNKYVREGIEALEKYCAHSLIIKHVGKVENETNLICACTQHKHLLLYYYQELSPVLCGTCEKAIPLFRLPHLHDFGFWNLTSWQSAYMACVMLDLNCGTGEKWAIKQQCDPRSGLSKQGRAVGEKIMEAMGVKTYYFLSNFSKGSRKKDINRPCPGCGGPWRLKNEIHKYVRYQCDTCLLMSAESTNTK
jgi:predicted  nucleic acid-binding Zn ribbon protein